MIKRELTPCLFQVELPRLFIPLLHEILHGQMLTGSNEEMTLNPDK